jgi:hypothetical protein
MRRLPTAAQDAILPHLGLAAASLMTQQFECCRRTVTIWTGDH